MRGGEGEALSAGFLGRELCGPGSSMAGAGRVLLSLLCSAEVGGAECTAAGEVPGVFPSPRLLSLLRP